jgi:hypothetical protein
VVADAGPPRLQDWEGAHMTFFRCQHENPDDARFCCVCGSPLGRVCPSCGRVSAPDSYFCTMCGHALAAVPALSELQRGAPQALHAAAPSVLPLHRKTNTFLRSGKSSFAAPTMFKRSPASAISSVSLKKFAKRLKKTRKPKPSRNLQDFSHSTRAIIAHIER